MFGYIRPNVEELRVREARAYAAYYCGLCCTLRQDFGETGRISLSYDMTFLSLLLSSLYELDDTAEKKRCPLHPFSGRRAITNEAARYAAEMNILLTHEKCRDDFRDEKKMMRGLYGRHLGRKSHVLAEKHKEKIEIISEILDLMYAEENGGSLDFEKMAALFGRAFEEVFVYKEDVWEGYLRKMGNALGRYVYILDAWDDFETDREKGLYNPLIRIHDDPAYEKIIKTMLLQNITEAAQAFECLPVIKNVEILRNIIYSGVWGGMGRQNKGGGRCGSVRDFGR